MFRIIIYLFWIVIDPARINRTSPLPKPPPDTIIDGAGRPDEALQVMDNMTVILHCPVRGIDMPMTMWYRVRTDRRIVPINTTAEPAFMIDRTDPLNPILTISPFNPSLAGTYRCTTTNIAGDDDGDVVIRCKDIIVIAILI